MSAWSYTLTMRGTAPCGCSLTLTSCPVGAIPAAHDKPGGQKQRILGDQGSDTEASINGTYYILCYLQDSPKLKNLVHTLVIDSKGTVVKACTYKLNNAEYIGTISATWNGLQNYKGSEVFGFVNDSGDDNYLIMHDGVLKSVYFRVSRKGTTWKETCYPLPKGTTVPSNVLDSLHADYPDFTYTEVSILETPDRIVYLFTDGNRSDRLGHYVEAS